MHRLTLLLVPLLALGFVGLGPSIAHSGEPPPSDAATTAGAPARRTTATRVHPLIETLFAHRDRTSLTHPFFRADRQFEDTGEMPLVVRFRHAPDLRAEERLLRRGVRFTHGLRPTLSNGYLVRATRRGVAELTRDANVERMTADMPRPTKGPMATDGGEVTGALAARRAIVAKRGQALDGAGTLIVDIDTSLYLHHPNFFRADGGFSAWVDVDRDGRLTPGVDGIDVDSNAAIAPSEILKPLLSNVTTPAAVAIEPHASFEPARDYLFLDTNGNGVRDSGAVGGFVENDPAYGEPLFVFDDADRDGFAATSERVVRLGTHKFRGIRAANKTYLRGASGSNPLIAYDPENNPAVRTIKHATGSNGIVAGGHLGISRWLGLAPGAELMLDDQTSDGGLVTAVDWAIRQDPDIILTEWSEWQMVSLDGSGEEDLLLDAANDAGIITVSPSGNLASGRKHRTVTLKAGATKIALSGDAQLARAQAISISLHHRGEARAITAQLRLPAGEATALPDSAPSGEELPSGKVVYVNAQTTPRGTHERFIQVVGQTGSLVEGAYELTLTLDAGPDLEVDLYAGENLSVWTGGFSFDEGTPTRTLCSPSTSDKTLVVGAYVLNDGPLFGSFGARGDLAVYSSRGPRLGGGALGSGITGPDNPITLAAPKTPGDLAAFSTFGGTSGAGAHVAGAIALIRQAYPSDTPAQVRKRLLDAAIAEGTSMEAVNEFGAGKLDIAAAVGGPVVSGPSPTVVLEVEEPARVGAIARVRVEANDDEPAEALSARWDVDYDGVFDTQWIAVGAQEVPVGDRGEGDRVAVKVEVRDAQGNVTARTANLVVRGPIAAPAASAAAPGKSGESGCAASGRGGGHDSDALLFATSLLLAARRERPRRETSSPKREAGPAHRSRPVRRSFLFGGIPAHAAGPSAMSR